MTCSFDVYDFTGAVRTPVCAKILAASSDGAEALGASPSMPIDAVIKVAAMRRVRAAC